MHSRNIYRYIKYFGLYATIFAATAASYSFLYDTSLIFYTGIPFNQVPFSIADLTTGFMNWLPILLNSTGYWIISNFLPINDGQAFSDIGTGIKTSVKFLFKDRKSLIQEVIEFVIIISFFLIGAAIALLFVLIIIYDLYLFFLKGDYGYLLSPFSMAYTFYVFLKLTNEFKKEQKTRNTSHIVIWILLYIGISCASSSLSFAREQSEKQPENIIWMQTGEKIKCNIFLSLDKGYLINSFGYYAFIQRDNVKIITYGQTKPLTEKAKCEFYKTNCKLLWGKIPY